MRVLYNLILLTTFLLSCNSKSDYIEKEDILDSVFVQFDSVESISYEVDFVFADKVDTATTFAYYEEAHDSTGYLLNYNCATYISGEIFYQDVFNTYENTVYYHTQEKSTITDYNNPPKMFGGISSISFSLLTYIKLLRQTLKDYPEYITIKDTLINETELYNIEFFSPDGIPLKDRPMVCFNDTIYPLKLFVDKSTATVKYRAWDKTSYRISNIHFNPNQPDSIWSMTNLPDYFRKNIGKLYNYEAKLVIPVGNRIPNWKFKTIDSKDHKIVDDSNYRIYVFFSRRCGACIMEIPILNRLNKIDNIEVIGVYFEDNINDLKDFTKKHKIEYDVVFNKDKELKEKFKNGGFPVNYLIDNEGKILYSILGNIPGFEENVLEIINK